MKKIISFIGITIMILTLFIIPTGCSGEKDQSQLNEFTLGSSTAYDTLNPLSSYMQVTYEFFQLTYDPLVRLDENYETTP